MLNEVKHPCHKRMARRTSEGCFAALSMTSPTTVMLNEVKHPCHKRMARRASEGRFAALSMTVDGVLVSKE